MKIFWTIFRVLVIAAALLVLFVTPVWTESPTGREILPAGAIIALAAVVALTVAAGSLWRDRRRLFS